MINVRQLQFTYPGASEEIILEEKRRDTAVFFTPYNMHTAKDLCDRVALKQRWRRIVLAIATILSVPAVCYTNSAAIYRSPDPYAGGRLYVAKQNGLKIRREVVTFDIQEDGLDAAVRVEYEIVNTRDEPFDGRLFFIAPVEFRVSDFDILVGSERVLYQAVDKATLDEVLHEDIEESSGILFSFALAGGESRKVVVVYTQRYGYRLDDKNPSAAATSHWLNAVRHGGHTSTIFFRYYLFPILTFSEGVEEMVIRVTWPKRSKRGKRVENFESNLKLNKTHEDKRSVTYEGRFTDVPADIFEFSFYTGRWDRLGFTLYPAYELVLPDRRSAFSMALNLDLIIRNVQLSLGARYGTVDTFQLVEEVKVFPPGRHTGLASLFDYRFALGVVEQLVPDLNMGFKASAGFRIVVALELTYQVFPPLLGDGWTHEILIGMPFSF